MIKTFIYNLLAAVGLVAGLTACEDAIEFNRGEIPEGEIELSFDVCFKSYTSALSRSDGDAIREISSLWVVVYNSDGSLQLKKEITDFTVRTTQTNTRPDGGVSTDELTGHAEFKLKMLSGRYRFYAVANMDLSGEDVSSEALLRGIQAEWKWDNASPADNAEMFGWFSGGDGDSPAYNTGYEAATVEVSRNHTQLKAWLTRLASKVTVAFDGSRLKDGVSIYLKALRVRNIPRHCSVGFDNTVKKEDKEKELIDTGEEIHYAQGEDYNSAYPALITNGNPYYPRPEQANDGTEEWKTNWKKQVHSNDNPNSLFFYENRQGEGPDKFQKDNNHDGILDNLFEYNDMPCATYIEVDAYYISTNPDRPGISNITYRFMLGQDILNDYNADRNCHYKLTLGFNGFANEPDWRIDYVTVMWVPEPKVVDYQGRFFKPNDVKDTNRGHEFSDINTITVTSFMYDRDSWEHKSSIPYKIEYKDADWDEFRSDPPAWFELSESVSKGDGVYEHVIDYKNNYTGITLKDHFKSARPGVYDLATNGGTTDINTANCYIVDAPGKYSFPLVYGNALENGNSNTDSYTYRSYLSGVGILPVFLNYNNKAIKSPYIINDIYGTDGNAPSSFPSGLTASLVWQDESGLVTVMPDVNDGNITFTVADEIREGNAVIALKDASGKVMWNWHIWVTPITTLGEDITKIKNITLTNYFGTKYEILPVNLGWCSEDKEVRFYERHECEVRFSQIISENSAEEGITYTVKVIQEPHIALPCGNNPYYQWGRKDPFVAMYSDGSKKGMYKSDGSDAGDIKMIFSEDPDYTGRKTTRESIATMIQNPDRWYDCPREKNVNPTPPYVPVDEIYQNLWNNGAWDADKIIKTVYDPCPVGFNVSPYYTFTGFVLRNNDSDGTFGTNNKDIMFYVPEDKMLEGYKDKLFEFYTTYEEDHKKLESICFPQNGYRDWGDIAKVTSFDYGFAWLAQACLSYNWGWTQHYLAYHLEYYRNSDPDHLWPTNNFYSSDGMPVRPTKAF